MNDVLWIDHKPFNVFSTVCYDGQYEQVHSDLDEMIKDLRDIFRINKFITKVNILSTLPIVEKLREEFPDKEIN